MRDHRLKNGMERILPWRRTLTAVIAATLTLGLTAQTQVSQYRPGVTAEGATFFLPKTVVQVTVRMEKRTYTPGRLAQYAQRYLRLNDVSTEPSVDYSIVSVSMNPIGVADTSKAYSVKYNNKTAAINVALADDYTLLAINATPLRTETPQPFVPARKPEPLMPEKYMNEEILAAGSTAKMAQLTAQEIYDLRDNRSQLIKGQADFMPKDGEQLRLMLNQLELQDRALSSLFTGTVVCDTTEEVVNICPRGETRQALLFRFSKKMGMVDDDDLAGAPCFIDINNLTALPKAAPAETKKKKAENGLYYNVPGRMRCTVYYGNDKLASEEMPAAQFGHVELLSADLFNKHYGTRLWLNPITGGIDKLEAERPK